MSFAASRIIALSIAGSIHPINTIIGLIFQWIILAIIIHFSSNAIILTKNGQRISFCLRSGFLLTFIPVSFKDKINYFFLYSFYGIEKIFLASWFIFSDFYMEGNILYTGCVILCLINYVIGIILCKFS